jgi:hypothetical protein
MGKIQLSVHAPKHVKLRPFHTGRATDGRRRYSGRTSRCWRSDYNYRRRINCQFLRAGASHKQNDCVKSFGRNPHHIHGAIWREGDGSVQNCCPLILSRCLGIAEPTNPSIARNRTTNSSYGSSGKSGRSKSVGSWQVGHADHAKIEPAEPHRTAFHGRFLSRKKLLPTLILMKLVTMHRQAVIS